MISRSEHPQGERFDPRLARTNLQVVDSKELKSATLCARYNPDCSECPSVPARVWAAINHRPNWRRWHGRGVSSLRYTLERTVAIKVLPDHAANDAQFRERFEREARAASALNHPNILTVFDVGRERDAAFLVMELIDGVTLRERIADCALPPREVVSIGAQIADGLAAAHQAGLVHRDLKPDNVMVTRDGRVKILDFGLAKPLATSLAGQHTQTAISEAGMLVGTIGYVAPEQVRGGAATAQSDLFSLGVVLYESATGQRTFPARQRSKRSTRF